MVLLTVFDCDIQSVWMDYTWTNIYPFGRNHSHPKRLATEARTHASMEGAAAPSSPNPQLEAGKMGQQ